jgi:hypothetical protein
MRFAAEIGVTAAALSGVALPLQAQGAFANTAGCDWESNVHCYSRLKGTGTTFYGMTGTWGRVNMSTTGSHDNPTFMDSEMWFPQTCLGPGWVEEGLADGWSGYQGGLHYNSFYAYNTSSNAYNEFDIQNLSVNAGTTDAYQISRSGTTNKWNVWWDGNMWTTPDVGFWSGNCPVMGAEVATPVGHAGTFTMYSKAINSASQFVNWGSQGGVFEPPQPGNPLNGFSYQNSEWSWNTEQP